MKSQVYEVAEAVAQARVKKVSMRFRHIVARIVSTVTLLLLGGSLLAAQRIPQSQRVFNELVLRPAGQPVIPIFDGWYENPDGTKSMCFGYKNLNLEEALEIPLGPDNFIEPSEFDGFQPTHFAPAPESFDPESEKARYRRQYCVFTVQVPADFSEQQVVWTLRIRGETISNPGNLLPAYVIDEPQASGRGASAPLVKVGEDEREARGRERVIVGPFRARVREPLPLTLSVGDPGARAWVGWFKHQGPGEVTFAKSELSVEGPDGTVTTTVWFSQPGEYLLLAQTIDTVASFEFICCWTNVYVRVLVE